MANRKHTLARAIEHSMHDHDDYTSTQKIPRKVRLRMERERAKFTGTNVGEAIMMAYFTDMDTDF